MSDRIPRLEWTWMMKAARAWTRVSTSGALLEFGLAVACSMADRSDNAESASAEDHRARTEVLQSQLGELGEKTGIPGIVVAVSEGSTAPLVAAAGYADVRAEIPLLPETPSVIGRISKNLFATITLQLVEEGFLRLEDPISDHLQWPREDEITARMLLNQRDGQLPKRKFLEIRYGLDYGVRTPIRVPGVVYDGINYS